MNPLAQGLTHTGRRNRRFFFSKTGCKQLGGVLLGRRAALAQWQQRQRFGKVYVLMLVDVLEDVLVLVDVLEDVLVLVDLLEDVLDFCACACSACA